jgi:hypothetical protein
MFKFYKRREKKKARMEEFDCGGAVTTVIGGLEDAWSS